MKTLPKRAGAPAGKLNGYQATTVKREWLLMPRGDLGYIPQQNRTV